MAFWGDNFFVGFGALGLIVGAVLFFSKSGPFEECVTNGFGAEFCGEQAKSYCRDVSDQVAGRTDACNEILGEDEPVGAGGLDETLTPDPASQDYGTGGGYGTEDYLDESTSGYGTDACLDDPALC